MNELRTAWNRIFIWSFDVFFYDWASLLGWVLLIAASVFLVHPVKGISFPAKIALGFAGYLAAYLVLSVSGRKRQQRKKLRQSGTKVKGEVTGICRSIAKVHLNTMHYADEDAVHPFSIQYRYCFDGAEYTGTSEYFWAHPRLKEGDTVTLFVDCECPGHSACDDAEIELI